MKKICLITVVLLLTGFLNAQHAGFKWLREIRFSAVNTYRDGMAAFMQEGKWGFLDKEGQIVIPALYTEVRDFQNDIALVKQECKWGVIKKDGTFLFDALFTSISEFDSGIALAKIDQVSYYLTVDGKKLELSPLYTYTPYKEGFARVCQKGKWGYINVKGDFIIEPRFKAASDFSGGLAWVNRKDDIYYINSKGSKRPTMLIDTTAHFREGLAKVGNDDNYTFLKSEMLSYLPVRFKEASDFQEGLAAVKFQDDTRGFVNRSGRCVIVANYSELGNFSEGLAKINAHGKFGYINRTGELVIDTIFDSATDFSDGLAYVNYQGRLGVIKPREEEDRLSQAQIVELTLSDQNKDGKVEAEEYFTLSVKIKNNGSEPLKGLKISLQGDYSELAWFDFSKKSFTLDSLGISKDSTLMFSGKAKLEVQSKEVDFSIKMEADNLFLAQTNKVTTITLGINDCKPLLASYWVFKSNHTPLKAGDQVNLKIDLVNEGKEMAKDVKIALIWPAGTKGDSIPLHMPVVESGERKSLMTTFRLDSLTALKQFTIVASLSEYTQTKSDIKYFTFEAGKMNTETALITNQSAYPFPGVTIAQQPTGQELNHPIEVQSELLIGLEQLNQPSSNKYALIIGNENYDDYKQTVSSEQNVEFAVQDASTFAVYAKDIMGVPEQNIILLKNATYAQMNFNINKLSQMSKSTPNTVELIVYYAGHGQHDANTKETFLIPVDVSIATPTQGIKLEQMYAQLSSSETKRTMVFLDACYSGVGRGIVIKPKDAPVKGNLLVMTASSSTQRSMPYKEKHHGMFTYFLLKTLKESQGKITVSDLYSSVRKSVEKNSIWINNSKQSPELIKGEGIQADWSTWPVY